MRILILSFYYRPDLSACSFRSTALVRALAEQAPDVDIEVLTTLPHRYRSFAVPVAEVESFGRVRVRRIPLPEHSGRMIDQSRAFLTYARRVQQATRGEQYDLVFATSSRLMTAVLGARIARRLRATLYLDIRDIFVDTITDVLPGRASLLAPFFARLERWAVERAQVVNLVSRGFAEYFRERYPRQRYSFHTNGIDDEFLEAFAEPPVPPSDVGAPSRRPIRVLYAGNMGAGQGLDDIVPRLAAALKDRIEFRLIGDGAQRGALEAAVVARGLQNVTVLPPMGRSDLVREYRAADVLFLHLNDLAAFEKVLPSKIFEYAATKKPIWAGVRGFSAKFLSERVANASVFSPQDAEGAQRAFEVLELRETDRTAFVQAFTRRSISRAMADEILAIARPTGG